MNLPDGGPAAPGASTPRLNLRNLWSLAVVLAVLAGGFLAISKGDDTDTAADAESVASRAVASSDLVELAVADKSVSRATGGYVPGVGIVITAELDELDVGRIRQWTRDLVARSSPVVRDMGAGEEVIFLLDIARPARTSRLISLSAGELAGVGGPDGREAPAISTRPVEPVFESEPTE